MQQRRVFLFILIDWTVKSSKPHPRKNIATRREEKLSTDRKELKKHATVSSFYAQALPVTFAFFPNSLIEIMQSAELAALAKVRYEMSE